MTDLMQYDPEAEAPLLSQDIQATGESMGFLYGGPDYQQYQMFRLAGRAKALEMGQNEWEAATRHLLEHYPEDVFPPNSNTPDAKAGTFARRLLGWLLNPVERARLAALAKETP